MALQKLAVFLCPLVAVGTIRADDLLSTIPFDTPAALSVSAAFGIPSDVHRTREGGAPHKTRGSQSERKSQVDATTSAAGTAVTGGSQSNYSPASSQTPGTDGVTEMYSSDLPYMPVFTNSGMSLSYIAVVPAVISGMRAATSSVTGAASNPLSQSSDQSSVPSSSGLATPSAVQLDELSNTFAAANSTPVATTVSADGVVTPITPSTSGTGTSSGPVTPVNHGLDAIDSTSDSAPAPEPSSILLLGACALGFGRFLRRAR